MRSPWVFWSAVAGSVANWGLSTAGLLDLSTPYAWGTGLALGAAMLWTWRRRTRARHLAGFLLVQVPLVGLSALALHRHGAPWPVLAAAAAFLAAAEYTTGLYTDGFVERHRQQRAWAAQGGDR